MKFWICRECGLVHSDKTTKCECGNSILSLVLTKYPWVYFNSVEELEEWIVKMKKHMGAKLKYAGD